MFSAFLGFLLKLNYIIKRLESQYPASRTSNFGSRMRIDKTQQESDVTFVGTRGANLAAQADKSHWVQYACSRIGK